MALTPMELMSSTNDVIVFSGVIVFIIFMMPEFSAKLSMLNGIDKKKGP